LADRQGMSCADALDLLRAMHAISGEGYVGQYRNKRNRIVAACWDGLEAGAYVWTRRRRFYWLEPKAFADFSRHKLCDLGYRYEQLAPEKFGIGAELAAVTRRAFVPRLYTQLYARHPLVSMLCPTKTTP
jgi:hypothetical protein